MGKYEFCTPNSLISLLNHSTLTMSHTDTAEKHSIEYLE